MCVGIPMQLVSIDGATGVVEEAGVRQEVGLALLDDPQIGDFVIIHAGYAIQKLDPAEAKETLDLLKKVGLAPGEGRT